jgi:TrmH family RNA methyltransferase
MAVATPRPPRTDVVGFARRPAVDLDGVLAAAIRPVVLLDNPRNLGNLGAVVRVAAAAGAAAVLTTGDHDPWAAPALRGSAGLHFALPVLRVRSLPARGRPIVAVDPDGDPLGAEPMPAGAVYAFGSERHGLSEAVRAAASIRVAIPMRSGVSSLNLATAVAVALYHPMVS